MKAKVTISRASDDMVRIRIRDEVSGIDFAEVSLTVEAYGYAVAGLSEQPGELEVRGLQWVGKKRITEQRQILCPLDTYNRDALEAWLRDNGKEDGWLVSTYLGSQKSVSRAAGGVLLNYSVTKYVDA